MSGVAPPPLRALVVDDEPLARLRLRMLLADHQDFVVVGECGDGTEALAAVRALRPDVVFLDVQMAEMDGVAAARELEAGGTRTRRRRWCSSPRSTSTRCAPSRCTRSTTCSSRSTSGGSR